MTPSRRPLPRALRQAWASPTGRGLALAILADAARDAADALDGARPHLVDPATAALCSAQAADRRRHATLLRAQAGPADPPVDVPVAAAQRRRLARLLPRWVPSTPRERLLRQGDVAFAAVVEVQAQRAQACYRQLAGQCADDPATGGLLTLLAEELWGHATAAGRWLADHRRAGHGRAVDLQRRLAGRAPALRRWLDTGMRSGAGFSRLLLRAMYWTVLVPFGLLARPTRARPPRPSRPTSLGSQY